MTTRARPCWRDTGSEEVRLRSWTRAAGRHVIGDCLALATPLESSQTFEPLLDLLATIDASRPEARR